MSFIVNRNDRLNVYVEDLTHDGRVLQKWMAIRFSFPAHFLVKRLKYKW